MRVVCRLLIVASLLATLASVLRVYPHQLAYFNELAGGPQDAHRHLLHSNLDWGQDFLHLKEWAEAHPEARPLYVRGARMFDPADVGVDCVPRSEDRHSNLLPGWYAVSANELQRRGLLSPVHGEKHPVEDELSKTLQGNMPIGRAGASIYIYRVDEPAKP